MKKSLQIQLLPCNIGAQIETRKQQPICTFCVPISVMWIAYSSRPLLPLDDHAAQPNTENLSSGVQSNTENLNSGLQPNTENLSSVTQPNNGNYLSSGLQPNTENLSSGLQTKHWKSEVRHSNPILEII